MFRLMFSSSPQKSQRRYLGRSGGKETACEACKRKPVFLGKNQKITAAGRKRCRLPAKISCVSFFHHQRPVPPGFNFCKKEKISLDFLREIVIIIMRFGKRPLRGFV